MKNYVYSLHRMIGDETDEGFFTPVVFEGETILVPNFEEDHALDVYPKIILRPFISYLPVVRGVKDDETYFTSHNGRIQIDILTKNEEQLIDITEVIQNRFRDFFYPHVIDWVDPYDWETYNSIKVNKNYDDERRIFQIGALVRKDTITEVEETINSWCLLESGLYVNGDVESKMFELVEGLLFEPELETAMQKGFTGIDDKTQMRKMGGEDPDTFKFTLDYDLVYNSYRIRRQAGIVDNMYVSKEESE